MCAWCHIPGKAKTGVDPFGSTPAPCDGSVPLTLLGRGTAAASLSLSALRAVLFLDADEAQPASMLAQNARTLDGLIESTKKLFKAFVISNLNTHKPESPPNQTRVYNSGLK